MEGDRDGRVLDTVDGELEQWNKHILGEEAQFFEQLDGELTNGETAAGGDAAPNAADRTCPCERAGRPLRGMRGLLMNGEPCVPAEGKPCPPDGASAASAQIKTFCTMSHTDRSPKARQSHVRKGSSRCPKPSHTTRSPSAQKLPSESDCASQLTDGGSHLFVNAGPGGTSGGGGSKDSVCSSPGRVGRMR